MITVTRQFLPPLNKFSEYLKPIWKHKVLTDTGSFQQQLEKELCENLGVKYISLFSNGRLTLITALLSRHITDEAITTPYSFVATTHFTNRYVSPEYLDGCFRSTLFGFVFKYFV